MKLPVMNFNELAQCSVDKEGKRHGVLLPNSVRAVIYDLFNCGKTNAHLALITHPYGLRFESVYVYLKSLNQPKYIFLRRLP